MSNAENLIYPFNFSPLESNDACNMLSTVHRFDQEVLAPRTQIEGNQTTYDIPGD